MSAEDTPDEQSLVVDGESVALDPDNVGRYPIDEDGPHGAAGGTTTMLFRFLQRTPFLDLHERAGDPEAHPWRRRLCFAADFCLHAIAATLLLGIIAALAYKTLAPLPAFSP